MPLRMVVMPPNLPLALRMAVPSEYVVGASSMTVPRVMAPVSSAAAYSPTILMTEPGCRTLETARLKVRLPSFSPRPPTMAFTCPVAGSITTTEAWASELYQLSRLISSSQMACSSLSWVA